MAAISTDDISFQKTILEWLATNGEILVVTHIAGGAGSRDFELFRSVDEFNSRLHTLPSTACVTVVRDFCLPFRGRVDDELVGRAVEMFADCQECLIMRIEPTIVGSASWLHHHVAESLDELVTELKEEYCFNQLVAVGEYPRWWEPTDGVIEAITPNSDGSITIGSY